MDPLTLIGAIPTALNTLQSLGSLFAEPYTPPKQFQENSRQVFKQGGQLRGHNNYNAPSHEQGGQLVNKDGTPTPSGIDEIEKNESKYTYSNIKKSTYVFNPEDTKKVNKLTKKYKDANSSALDKNALELEVQRIENNNEMKKAKQAVKQPTNKYNLGGLLNPGPGPKVGLGGGILEAFNMLNGLQNLGQELPHIRKTSTAPQMGNLVPGPKAINPIAPLPRDNDLNLNFAGKSINTPGYFNQKFPNATTTTPTTTVPKANNELKTLETLRNLTLAGSSLGLLKSPEKEDPIMTDYGPARQELNKLSSNLDPLRQEAAQTSNQMRNVNRNSASSFNTFANREAQRVGNLTQTLSGITLQERNLGNAIAGQRAQFESGVALDNSNTLRNNRIANQQNQAVTDRIKSEITADGMSELDRKSTIINNANIATATRAESMSLLSSMFTNFKPGDYPVIEKVSKSGYDSLTPEEKKRFDNLETVDYKSK